jgi:hypothetical protein
MITLPPKPRPGRQKRPKRTDAAGIAKLKQVDRIEDDFRWIATHFPFLEGLFVPTMVRPCRARIGNRPFSLVL